MVITNVNQVVYQGDGVTTAFPFTFRIIDATDIKLLLLDSDGTETDITSDYYVDTENDTVHYPGYAPGAEPALSDRPPVLAEGQKLVIYRKLPITQEKDLGDKWPFYVIELGLDKLTMILQDIWDWLGRCLCVSKGKAYEAGDDFDPTIPLEADKVICGNANATGYEAREALMEVNGVWDGEGRQIHSVADPTAAQDAATKNYVDTLTDNNFMKLQPDGTAWKGRNLPISNVGGPVLVKDAATKDYVDRILEGYSGQGERFKIFDNVAQMQAADLIPSQVVATQGYTDINDGGAAVYTIRPKRQSDVEDGGSIIFLDNGNVAELITDGTVCPEQFGAYGDGVRDDSAYVQSAVNFAINTKKTVLFGKDYLIHNIACNGDFDFIFTGKIKPLYYESDHCVFKNIFSVTNVDSGCFDGLYVEGDDYNPAGTASTQKTEGAVVLNNCDTVTLKNCTFYNLDNTHHGATPSDRLARRAIAIVALGVKKLYVNNCVFNKLIYDEIIYGYPLSLTDVNNEIFVENCKWFNITNGYSALSATAKSIKLNNCIVDNYTWWGNVFNLAGLYVSATNNIFKNVSTEIIFRTSNVNYDYNECVNISNNTIESSCRVNKLIVTLGNNVNIDNNVCLSTMALASTDAYSDNYSGICPATKNSMTLSIKNNYLKTRNSTDEHDGSSVSTKAMVMVHRATQVVMDGNTLITALSDRTCTVIQNTIDAKITNNFLPLGRLLISGSKASAVEEYDTFVDDTSKRTYVVSNNVFYKGGNTIGEAYGVWGSSQGTKPAGVTNYITISGNILYDVGATVGVVNDLSSIFDGNVVSGNVGFV